VGLVQVQAPIGVNRVSRRAFLTPTVTENANSLTSLTFDPSWRTTMKTDQRKILILALERAQKMDLEPTQQWCVQVVDGRYSPDFKEHRYHPLETVLFGEEVRADPLSQIAEILGQDKEWITGFNDRFKGLPSNNVGINYQSGYNEASVKEIAKLLK
jgi:hypothetical protein